MVKATIAVRFGKRLVQIRKQKKLNQVDLAAHSGLSRSTIAMIETGRKGPSLETLEVLAEAFDMRLSELFRGV